MANEKLGGASPEELRAARSRMFKWGGVAAGALAVFVYSFFFGFVPAAKQYKQIKEKLSVAVIKADGTTIQYGHVEKITRNTDIAWLPKLAEAQALIVDAGETKLRDCFIATSCTSVQAFKFHGLGTSGTAAGETQTGCQTELTTQYNPDSTRATGSQTNNGANIYRTVGTNTVDATAAVQEWCLMDASSAGNMWSRITFTTINLAASDSLQTTYDLTIE